MPETQMIHCPACGAVNRVAPQPLHEGRKAVCGRCKADLPAGSPVMTITDSTFSNEVERSTLPVLLDMWAAWCGPCLRLAPVVEEIAGQMAGRVLVAKLNVDENPISAERFNIRSLPTLLVLKNGREIDRIVGALPKGEILRRLEQAIA